MKLFVAAPVDRWRNERPIKHYLRDGKPACGVRPFTLGQAEAVDVDGVTCRRCQRCAARDVADLTEESAA